MLKKGYLIADTYSSRVQMSFTSDPFMIHAIFVGIENPNTLFSSVNFQENIIYILLFHPI